MPSSELRALPPNRATLLHNKTCVYCSKPFEDIESTKEHVIGRRFVPRGTLDREWNLIVLACGPCNNMKSLLEDDLSAITMQPDAAGVHATEDPVLRDEADRKAKNSVSRRTGKRVAESKETFSISMPFGPGVVFTFSCVAAPQPDEARAFELARLQLVGFFYFLTYKAETRQGGYWLHSFSPLNAAFRSDWGNPLQVGFANAVKDWEPRLIGTSAQGYFVVAIRRHPNAETWSWALEWNQSYRLVGFFGEIGPAQEVVDGLPPLEMHEVAHLGERPMRVRTETPLSDTDDHLFAWSGRVSPIEV